MDPLATKQWLTHRVFKSGMREIITKTLSAESAQYGRDALLKFVYEKMFSWIVCLINKALGIDLIMKNVHVHILIFIIVDE